MTPGASPKEDLMHIDKPDSALVIESAVGAHTTSKRKGQLETWLDRMFSLSARGTSVRTEALAGLATFATMAYVLAVNPMILAESGMDRGELITATALAAGVFSILMGLAANVIARLGRTVRRHGRQRQRETAASSRL